MSSQPVHDVIVIGSGPAGYTAAIYTARAELNPLVFEGTSFGGALMTTTEVENYPGFRNGIQGPELMEEMREQALRFGADLQMEDVESVSLDGPVKEVVTAGGQTHRARAVILAMGAAAAVGLWAVRPGHLSPASHHDYGIRQAVGLAMLLIFALLLIGLPAVAYLTESPLIAVISAFYKSGALVFGGGHVVLPLLQANVVPNGLVSDDMFLAGYGAAQAMPGPLFTFAAYLGAAMSGALGGWAGGLILLGAICVPAFLLVFGALPFWEDLRQRDAVQSAMAGVNAGVVGLLGAALYDPIWTSTVHSRADFGIALAVFGLLVYGRLSPAVAVVMAAMTGWLLTL